MTILAATVPGNDNIPTSTVDTTTGKVIIAWDDPTFTGGINVPIDSVTIMIDDVDGTPKEIAECDGSDPTTFGAKQCVIEMDKMTESPLFLIQGGDIKVSIIQTNEIGSGDPSDKTTVPAKVETVPTKMAPVTRDNDLTDDTTMVVDYIALTDPANGGAGIISYHV